LKGGVDQTELERALRPRGGAGDDSLRFFCESSPLLMGTVALRPDGELLHLYDNPATCAFFGFSPGSTMGRSPRELGASDATVETWRRRYQEAARLQAPVHFEYEHLGPLGSRVLAVTLAPMPKAGTDGEARFSYVAADVTERRAAAAALAESEARLRSTFEQAAVGIAHVALDGGWLMVNQRLCAMFGYSEAELRALRFQDVTHPDDLAEDLENVNRLVAGAASTYAMEKRYQRKDGRLFWGQLTVSLLRDAEGRPEHFISVVEDITARKVAEQALRVTEHRLEVATSASGLGVWEWDLEDDSVYSSPRAREIYGVPLDQPVTYAELAAMTHPDDLFITTEQARRAREPDARDHRAYEYRIIHPRLGLRWVRAHGEMVSEPGPHGPGPRRYIGTVEDVTERRTLEDELRAAAARLKFAMEAGRMAIFEWPLDETEPPLTPELREQLRIPADADARAEQLEANIHADDRAVARAIFQRAASGRERFIDIEYRYFWPDGQMRWFQVRSEVVEVAAGGAPHLIGVQLDVTDQRETEERLQLLAREVDHRANNLLTVVQSVVTLSKGSDAADLRQTLSGRISALARAHQLLAAGRWRGADLRRLAEEELRPYGLGDGDRIILAGPALSLSPAQAQGLGMALHELATNAAKYGALSQASGSVGISWARETEAIALIWVERGGPPVEPPQRKGLGTNILERALSGPMRGAIEMVWAPEGLTCRMRLPFRAEPDAG
jgi:PAS domain S-box-containing protein